MKKITIIISALFFFTLLYSGQTGKIAGYVKDKETGEPIIGANVIIEGTYLGAAVDEEGYYYINNVAPGTYRVIVSAIGYKKVTIKDVVVKIDITTDISVELYSEAVQLEGELVITAERPMVINDLTSSAASISSKDINMMPVENINQVVELQAGVIGGSFRGGRSDEVAYLIDGIPVTDAFSGGTSVQVENGSVRELEVISGTFNAEYGQAMSGIVNIVTKDGSHNFEGNVSYNTGLYYSENSKLFPNLNKFNSNIHDVQLSLSGPTKILKDLSFFVNGRYFKDDGYYYGKRVYTLDNTDPLVANGDQEFVPMETYNKKSINAKLTYNMKGFKLSYSAFWDDNESKYYSHQYRWAPDGMMNHFNENLVQNVNLTWIPSNSTVATINLSYGKYDYKGYLFEDELDQRYVHPTSGTPVSEYTFRFGGNQTNRYHRTTETFTGQFALESQVSKEHKIKLGAEVKSHKLFYHSKDLIDMNETDETVFERGYSAPQTISNQKYSKKPFEFAAYIQDKMEYEKMIINLGVRFDYFNANTTQPVDLRNPQQVRALDDKPGAYLTEDVETEFQISPRLGVSFPISHEGAIHFSYGHFFQIPTYENLYLNDLYLISNDNSLNSIVGNPSLKAQKTVKYEVGLQQVIFPDVSLDLTVYYNDVRNLLGMEILKTYNGFRYARYVNRDYGNTKGIIITLERRFVNFFSAKLDYTYQIAEGNSSDPESVYLDNQSDPPVESEKKLVPLDWDQRSTVNLSLNFGDPGNWTVGFILQYGSGMPYTEDTKISNGVRFENGGRRPTTLNCDLKAEKSFELFGLNMHANLLVYNVFDIKNEMYVYPTTGRATNDLDTQYAGEIIGLNTIQQYVDNPSFYSSPRQIRMGLNISF